MLPQKSELTFFGIARVVSHLDYAVSFTVNANHTFLARMIYLVAAITNEL